MSDLNFGRFTSVLYRHIQIIINDMLKPYGFGSGQYLFLIAVSKHKGISQKDLSAYLNIDKATTAKALAKLEKLGYIKRIKDENDRRYYKIYLTKKGSDFMPILKSKLNQISDILSDGLNSEQKSIMGEVFEIMIQNAVNKVNKL